MGGGSKPDSLVLTQVKLLNCVGMMYCGDERLRAIAKCNHSDLVSYCERDWKRLSEYPQLPSDNANHDWKTWCQAESSRRTGYCIWVSLVLVFAYFYQYLTQISSWIACGLSTFRCAHYCLLMMQSYPYRVKKCSGKQKRVWTGSSYMPARLVRY